MCLGRVLSSCFVAVVVVVVVVFAAAATTTARCGTVALWQWRDGEWGNGGMAQM